jgi:hypothetical protein
VTVTIDGAHSWIGDLDVTLIAPDSTAHVIFSRVGAKELLAGSGFLDCGDNHRLAGTYTFTDRAPASPTFAAAAHDAGQSVVPTGSYRTSTVGGWRSTLMTPVFAGLADLNGAWTLRVRDVDLGFTGSVASSSLTLTTASAPIGDAAAIRPERRPELLAGGALRAHRATGTFRGPTFPRTAH